MNGHNSGLGATGLQETISGASSIGGAVAGAALAGSVGGPIGTAIGAAIGLVGGVVSGLFTPNYNKIDSSNYANEIATQMAQNLFSWQALPQSSKTPQVQQYYIQNYANLWNQLVSYCSNPSLGTAGQNCINDREPGGKFPWATWYLDPIQNDTNLTMQSGTVVVTNPTSGVATDITPTLTSGTSSVSSLAETSIFGIPLWLLAAGVITVAIL